MLSSMIKYEMKKKSLNRSINLINIFLIKYVCD
jgi:hypothetical protein